MEDLINIDDLENDIKNDGLSNKLLNESFYSILLPSVYNYLDYTDFFILIRSEGVGKEVIAVITAIPITAGTPLAATAETTVIPKTRSNQINPSKGARNTSGLKVRFCNNVIVIKELSDIDITALNDKATMPGATTLETLQPMNQILECKGIMYLK